MGPSGVVLRPPHEAKCDNVLSECTRIIQLIEMKISVSMHDTSKLKALLTKMKDNETALKKIKFKLANASLT